MRDSLKEHIDNSREDFELYPFESDKEWSRIAKKIQQKPEREPWKLVSMAACFACIIACTLFFANTSYRSNEVSELERFYNGEIDQKISLIKYHIEDDEILKDLKEMDAVFAELKSDLKDNVDNEEVITAMMENYRLKLHILDEILNELEQEKREEVL